MAQPVTGVVRFQTQCAGSPNKAGPYLSSVGQGERLVTVKSERRELFAVTTVGRGANKGL